MSISSNKSTIVKQNSVFEKMRRFLFGDDIFISYSRVDSTYALSLANKLQAKPNNLSCFLDQWGTPPGEKLPDELIDTIRKCSTMVLIGSKNAADSENVGLEVKEFLETNRPMIPITFVADEVITNIPEDFNKQNLIGTLEQSKWYSLITGIAKTTEALSALKTRTPSENVISRIVNAVQFRSRRKRLRKALYTTLGAIGILVLIGTIVIVGLSRQAEAARNEANEAANTAIAKTEEANKAAEFANAEANRAKQQEEFANLKALEANNAAKEAKKQTKIASEKTRIAEDATKLANEKTELADKEAKRADAAGIQADRAELLAEAAQKKEAFANAEAKQQQRTAIGNRLVAESNVEVNSHFENADEKILLNIEGMKMSQVPEAYRNLIESSKLLPLQAEPKPYPDGNIQSLTFSLNGNFAAVVIDKKLFVENAANLFSKEKSEPSKPFIHENSIKQAEFSPDNEYLVTISGKNLRIWRTKLMEEIPSINFEKEIISLAFSGSGKYLAVGFQTDETTETPGVSAQILDVRKNYQLCASVYTRQSVVDFSFTLDEKQFTTVGEDGIKVWNAVGENQKQPIYSKVSIGINVFKGGFSLNNKYLFAVSSDDYRFMNVWKNDNEQGNYFRQFVQLRNFEFSPKGKFLVIASVDTETEYKSVELIELADEELKVVRQFPYDSRVSKSAFSQDDNYLALNTDKKITQIYETLTGRLIGFIKHEKPVKMLAFTPDKKHIVASEENIIKIWSLNDSYFESSVVDYPPTYEKITISPDGRRITHPDKNKLVFIDVLSKQITVPITNNCPIDKVVYNANGDRLALSGSCGISIWETADGENYKQSKSIKTESPEATVLALSPSGKWIAAVSDGNVHIYDTANPQNVIPLLQNSGEFSNKSVAFSPNEKFAALVEESGFEVPEIRIWDFQKRKEYSSLPYPRFFFPDFNHISIAFDISNGNLLANDNYNAYIWNVTQNAETQQLKFQEIGQLPLKIETDNSALETTISANGRFLVTKNFIPSSDDEIIVFKWLPEDIIKSICQRLNKAAFTEDEWKNKIGNEPYNQTCTGVPKLLPSLVFIE